MKLIVKAAAAVLTLGAVLGGSALAADTYQFDKVHSQIVFYVSHLGFTNSSGRFHVGDGNLVLDEQDFSKSSVQVTIPLSTLDMGDATWKQHLSDARFFNVEKFPTMTFKSTKVESVGKDQLKVTGDLTLLGVTKPVVLDTKINKIGQHPMLRRKAAGFTATTKIKRSDFGMSNMVPNIGDEIDIRIEAETNVPAPAGG